MMLLAVTVLPDGGEKYLKVRDSGTISASNSSVQRMLRIPKSVYQSVREHGEQAYPHECCGVLLGKCDGNGERVVMRAVRCGNTRTDSPQNRYNIDPRELIRIQLDSRKDGLDILGFYHSHPDHPAQWSETDFSEAHWLGCSYVISSVEQGRATVTNSFLLTGESEDNKRFEDESIRTFSQVNQQVTVLP